MNQKKRVESIANIDDNFPKWYTDVVTKTQLATYSGVRGCMYIHPYGTALWDNIRSELDSRFKATGHENVMLPMLISESLLKKEAEHIEGFAPEVAWITHGGNELLTERLCVRPTSEVLFCDYYKSVIHSYRDLPKLYNQWCSVVRWEKSTRPFLRTAEFYWQEGHTMHETADEAMQETEKMLNIYAEFCENALAMPIIKGRKTEKEKFAGAVATYTIEAIMHDKQALQVATSHYFGDGFAKAFNIAFTGRDGAVKTPHQTSWGMSTRIIGGIIMTHGDNNGLVLPPVVAPIQVIVIPVSQYKPGVIEEAQKLTERLSKICRVKLDADETNSPGWKFSEYEMKGIPLRVEYGPRDIENGTCVVARRDNGEKLTINTDCIEEQITTLLKAVHDGLFAKAMKRRDETTHSAMNIGEILSLLENRETGFIKAMWCGDETCEIKLKEETGITSRCIPFEQTMISKTCVCCGKPANQMLYWGKAY